jgi:hypothetical protein
VRARFRLFTLNIHTNSLSKVQYKNGNVLNILYNVDIYNNTGASKTIALWPARDTDTQDFNKLTVAFKFYV